MRFVGVVAAVLILLPSSGWAIDEPGPGPAPAPHHGAVISHLHAYHSGGQGVGGAVDLAIAVTQGFAASHGWLLPAVATEPLGLQEALERLAGFHPPAGAQAGAAHASVAQAKAALVGLPDALQAALAQVIAAFLDYEEAARLLAQQSQIAPWSTEHARLLAARNALLHTLPALEVAVQSGHTMSSNIIAAPLLALDLAGVDNVYEDDIALLIDVGGNDIYRNNAGGSRINAIDPPNFTATPCALVDAAGARVGVSAAGALIDLGGNDRYEPARGCGVNGGGNTGAGFLFDAAGDDIYVAPDEPSCDFAGLGIGRGSCGANGGGYRGIGFLMDLSGHDTYRGTIGGVNGGGYVGGQGYLFDLDGNDRYEAQSAGTNGGAHVLATGLLIDLRGNDDYSATSAGTNGGGDGAAGLLVDMAGDDRYVATRSGTNGGGAAALGPTMAQLGGSPDDVLPGRGALLDASGNDLYMATRDGANGGGVRRSVGLLLDGGGTDIYIDSEGGTGADQRVVPKGTGAQVDL